MNYEYFIIQKNNKILIFTFYNNVKIILTGRILNFIKNLYNLNPTKQNLYYSLNRADILSIVHLNAKIC